MVLVCDLESNGLVYGVDTVWVICAYNIENDFYTFSFDKSIEWTEELSKLVPQNYLVYRTHEEHLEYISSDEFCFHNYFQYDKLVLNKLYPEFSPIKSREHDSYILSQLFNPDRGLHGLDAWGKRFGIPKPEHEDWSQFSPEMLHRVVEDVKINVKTWHALMQEKKAWEDLGQSWDKAIKIEYGVAELQGRQEQHGVLFDEDNAYELAEEIWIEVHRAGDELKAQMPLRVIVDKEVDYEVAPFTKKGTLKAHVTNWFGDIDVGGPFRRVAFEEVNLNSPVQMKDFLLSQGWEPTAYTDKGSPQLTEDSYPSINGELGQLVAKRAVLKHRAQMLFNVNKKGQLKGLLSLVRPDGRIEAGAITNSTNTGRMAHRGLVNIPKPKDKGLWPSERQIRSLFIVPDGKLMMGSDADGLEARIMAHFVKIYPGGEAYALEILEGDIHAANSGIFDTDRDGAKSPFYLLIYGGTFIALANQLGCSEGKAKRIYNRFWSESTALSAFKEKITEFWKNKGKKYIVGIDGRRITIRSEHAIVNAAFQSAGSITVKVAALFLDKWCRENNLSTQQIIIYHDEIEYELPEHEQEPLSQLTPLAFNKAGEFLNLRVPITGSPVFGKNWESVH